MVNGRPIRGTRSEQSARLLARKQREHSKSLRHQSDVFAAKIADAAAKVGDGDRDVLLLAKLLVNKGLVDHRSAEAAGAAQANDTEHYTLDLQDMLTSRNFVGGEIEKKEKQGKFEASGWRTVGVESQIMIELERAFAPYESGAVEVDLTGYDPARQFGKSSDKHHILCLYSASDGAHGGWDDNSKAWLCWRVGKEYVSDSTGAAGCKIQAVPRGSQSHSEIRYAERRWDPYATYTLRIEFDAHSAALFVNGEPLLPLPNQATTVADFAGRRQSLGYVFVGMDNQTPGFEGVRFSNLRVWRRRLSAEQIAELRRAAGAETNPLKAIPSADLARGVAIGDLHELPRAELLRRLDLMAPSDPAAYGRVHYMVSTGLVPGKFGTKFPILRSEIVTDKLHTDYEKLVQLGDDLEGLFAVDRLETPLGVAARSWRTMYNQLQPLGEEFDATMPPLGATTSTSTTTSTTTTSTTTTTVAQQITVAADVPTPSPTPRPISSKEQEAKALERDARRLIAEHNKRVRKQRRKQAQQSGGGVVWSFDDTGALESKDVIVAGGARVDEHGLKPIDGAWYTNGSAALHASPLMSLVQIPARHEFKPIDVKSDMSIRMLRVVGLNVADGMPGVRESGGEAKKRMKRIVEWLRRVQPDIVMLWGLGENGVGMSHLTGDEERGGGAWQPSAVRSAAALWGHRNAKRLDTQSGMHMAVTSRFAIEPIFKAGKLFQFGGLTGERFATAPVKFFNGAHVVRVDVADPDDRDRSRLRPVYVVPTSLDPNSGIARRFEVQAVADAVFDGVPEPENAPVIVMGGLESLSRADDPQYRDLRTVEALRDSLLTEKRVMLNVDVGLLYDTMDVLTSFVADVCHSNATLDATLPTALADPLVSERFGGLRLDYVLANRRAVRLHREHERLLGRRRDNDAPLCGAVRDSETQQLSTRFPLVFEMAM